jgi:hypothetical protein
MLLRSARWVTAFDEVVATRSIKPSRMSAKAKGFVIIGRQRSFGFQVREN